MKKLHLTPVLLLVLIFLFPGAGFGQAVVSHPTIHFTAIRFGPDLGELNYQATAEEVRALQIPSGSDSALYAYAGPSPLVFFRQKTDEAGIVIREPVASVAIPEDAKNLLLFVFISEDQSRVRVVSLRDDAQTFEEGEFMLWNLSGHHVTANIAGSTATIPGGEFRKLKPKLEANEYYPARFFFRNDDSAPWVSFKNNAWTFRPSQRVLMIFLPGDTPGAPPRLFVRANRPPKPPPPPPTPKP